MSKKQEVPQSEEMLSALQDVLAFLGDCLLENGRFADSTFSDAVAEEMWRLYYGIYDITQVADSLVKKSGNRHQ